MERSGPVMRSHDGRVEEQAASIVVFISKFESEYTIGKREELFLQAGKYDRANDELLFIPLWTCVSSSGFRIRQ